MLLPKGVHAKHGRFYLVRRRAGRRQWIALTEVAAGPEALRAALAAASAPERVETIGELLEAYINGGMDELASATRREYERCISARLVPVFGHMRIDALRPSHVARYLEDGQEPNAAELDHTSNLRCLVVSKRVLDRLLQYFDDLAPPQPHRDHFAFMRNHLP